VSGIHGKSKNLPGPGNGIHRKYTIGCGLKVNKIPETMKNPEPF
jgi:hypothetical protein